MYICGRSGEYSVTYHATHLLFHQCVDPSTGYYGTMLYFTCDMIVLKFQIVSPIGLGYVDTLK